MSEGSTVEKVTVVVYSDDRTVRAQVRDALGTSVARDLPPLEVREVATQPALMAALENDVVDLVILDAEATPYGGMGISKQIGDEIASPPPILLLVARVADAWLATWARADAISSYPVDPVRLPEAAAGLLRTWLSEPAS